VWYSNNQLKGEPLSFHAYIINPMFGVHNSLTTLMTEYHSIESLQDAEDYISRLQKYGDKFNQLLDGLALQKEKGIIPPMVVIETTASVMADFIQDDTEKNILYTTLRKGLLELEDIALSKKIELNQQAKFILKTVVYPSYQKFINYLTTLRQIATEDAGVWKLPDGENYYCYCLRIHTTTNLSPEQIHKLGIKEVDRIQKQTTKILKSLGISEQKLFGKMINQYWRDFHKQSGSQLHYSTGGQAKQQVLADYQTIINDVSKELPKYFSLFPKTQVQVKAVPPFKETTMGAYYSPASLDGKRDGVFYVNLRNLPFKPDMKTLTYHEAIPGHHFQIAIQQESAENRLFRNLVYFTAYIEGWALYAEKLGMENGWFETPHTQLAYLNSELFRAVRLVVDTGIHFKRWSREQAFNYMVANLGWGSYREIDRYIVWPGQACAYKIGELKILELRTLAQKKLGNKFDIKEFHRIVLQDGSVPLEILEQLIEDYIQEKFDKS